MFLSLLSPPGISGPQLQRWTFSIVSQSAVTSRALARGFRNDSRARIHTEEIRAARMNGNCNAMFSLLHRLQRMGGDERVRWEYERRAMCVVEAIKRSRNRFQEGPPTYLLGVILYIMNKQD